MCAVLVLGVVFLGPELVRIGTDLFGEGVGLKDAAILSFFVTTVLFIVFAVVGGDGLLGEIQFMLASYFGFYIVFWLLIAWIF